jgi:8-oxo-dGTP pyrophosphatase MutT (NUDIX family)
VADAGTSAEELLDAYTSPIAQTSTVKSKSQAITDGDWVTGLHVWLYRPGPEAVVFCQRRGQHLDVGAGLLEATASGHYLAGEHGLDGLRELREEAGLDLPREQFTKWGDRLYVGLDVRGRERRTLLTVYSAPFEGDLDDFKLQPSELDGMYRLPLAELLQLILGKIPSLTARGIDAAGQEHSLTVTLDMLPHNPDEYHCHMVEYLAIKAGVLQ